MAYDREAMRIVSPEKYARLESWSQRKPCVALMGEFSAGKSTLLNFLIEEELLPTKATATELSPVWFSYGTKPSYWEDARGEIHLLDPKDLYNVPRSARYIRVYSQAEILEHCDVIDTPGISDPNLAVDSWRFAVGVCNMVLWCSSSTQAWRESERAAWVSLPERLRRHSLLIVTRADKLVAAGDKEKVDRRLARETTGLFASRVFLATPDAVQAKLELAEGGTSPLWEASGAADLLDRLAERFEGIYEDRAALLGRYATEAMVAEAAEPQIVPTRVRPVEPATPRPRPEESEDSLLPAMPAAAFSTGPTWAGEDVVPAGPEAEAPAAAGEAGADEDAALELAMSEGTEAVAGFEPVADDPPEAAAWQAEVAGAEAELEAEPEAGAASADPETEQTGGEQSGNGTILRMPLRPVRAPGEGRPRTERPSAAEAEELKARLRGDDVTTGEAQEGATGTGGEEERLSAMPWDLPDAALGAETPDDSMAVAEGGALSMEAEGIWEIAGAETDETAAEAARPGEAAHEAGQPTEAEPAEVAGVTLDDVVAAEANALEDLLLSEATDMSDEPAAPLEAADEDPAVAEPSIFEDAGDVSTDEVLALADIAPDAPEAGETAAGDAQPVAGDDVAAQSEVMAGGADADAPDGFLDAEEGDEVAAAAEIDEHIAPADMMVAAAADDEATLRAVSEALGDEGELTRTLILTAEHSVGEIAEVAAADVPREVAIWREIVSRNDLDPAAAQIVAMFDEFLMAAYGADRAGETKAAAGQRPGASGWRRLA